MVDSMKNKKYSFHFPLSILTILFVLFSVSACQKKPSAESGNIKSSVDDLSENIGWLHNNCLAIKNDDLKPGDIISIVLLGKKQTFLSSTVDKKTDSSVGCPQILDDRKSINTAEGNSFYLIRPTSNKIDLGIGLVGEVKGLNKINNMVAGDVNNDGKSDYFTECSSSEGIHFSVWSDMPWKGKKLWSSYYYLAYDLEPNCPK